MLASSMEEVGLFKQCCKWLLSQKQMPFHMQAAFCSFKEKLLLLFDRHWPMLYNGCVNFTKFLFLLLLLWRDSIVRGSKSFLHLGPAALFVVIWSLFLSLTSITYLLYILLMLVTAGAVVQYLGCTSGLFIAGVFGILLLWKYGSFWITELLLIVAGYFYTRNHARPVVFISTLYAIYCVKIHAGSLGVFLSINLAFFTNDAFSYVVQMHDRIPHEDAHFEEQEESKRIPEDSSSGSKYCSSSGESENSYSSKTSVEEITDTEPVNTENGPSPTNLAKEYLSSTDEMRRILDSLDHYEALGFSRSQSFDDSVLRKEYRRKAMLVHPDKNMGSPLASESFKKLQCAYEVLSDLTKRKAYDEQLWKEESRRFHEYCGTSQKEGVDYCADESRHIQCTKCGNSHLWICTSRSKAKARWCQDCVQYHPARDGEGWVEKTSQKVEIPRAFACAESMIFDVSEWAMCQGMICRPNTPAKLPCEHGWLREAITKIQDRSMPMGFGCGDVG